MNLEKDLVTLRYISYMYTSEMNKKEVQINLIYISERADGNIAAGIRYLVHNPYDIPMMDALASAVAPGSAALIAITLEQV